MQIVFFVLAAITVTAALGIVRSSNVVHAIIAHIITLLSIAGIYVILGAEFVAGVQVVIYAGAVTTMLLFAMMLTRVAAGGQKALDYPQVIPALLGAGLFFFLIFYCVQETNWAQEAPKKVIGVTQIGKSLFTYYVLPFEIISIILLAALVGAVVLARKEEQE